MAGGTKRNCFSGRKSYLSLSVSSFIQYSLSIQPIRHPLSVPDTRPGWPLWQQGRGSQIWTLITPLLLFPSRSRNWQTRICYILLTSRFLFFFYFHLTCPKNKQKKLYLCLIQLMHDLIQYIHFVFWGWGFCQFYFIFRKYIMQKDQIDIIQLDWNWTCIYHMSITY